MLNDLALLVYVCMPFDMSTSGCASQVELGATLSLYHNVNFRPEGECANTIIFAPSID